MQDQLRRPSDYLANRVILIECFDEDDLLQSRASGFLILHGASIWLYTCWHVFSGFSPHRVPRATPPLRTKAVIRLPVVEKIKAGIYPVVRSIDYEIVLWDEDQNPLWEQTGSTDVRREQGYPLHDICRIELSGIRAVKGFSNHNYFNEEDVSASIAEIGDDVFIVGYPFGYGHRFHSENPHPIFIRRSPAAAFQMIENLLDGPGAKGMSGGIVARKISDQWKLIGIYTGTVFPESRFQPTLPGAIKDRLDPRFGSELPLGNYVDLKFAISHLSSRVKGS